MRHRRNKPCVKIKMPENIIFNKRMVQSFGVKTSSIVIASFSLVVSLIWRDAIRSYIEKHFYLKDSKSGAYLVSAITLTFILVIVSIMNDRLSKGK